MADELMRDLPGDLPTFLTRFGTDAQCRAYLVRARWPEGFRCAGCGHERAYSHRARLIEECAACGKQHSLLAGTIFAQTKTGLARWFLAIFLVTSSKGGISAMELQRQMGFGSYGTGLEVFGADRTVMGAEQPALGEAEDEMDAGQSQREPGIAFPRRAVPRCGRGSLRGCRPRHPARSAAAAGRDGGRGPCRDRPRPRRRPRCCRPHHGRAGRTAARRSGALVLPEEPCAACGGGNFVQPPSEGWRCSTCEPVVLPRAHELDGWAFCCVPGGTAIPREPLPYPPGWGRPTVVYLDEILPDLATAPIGRCRSCRFMAPLSERNRCGRCEYAAMLKSEPI